MGLTVSEKFHKARADLAEARKDVARYSAMLRHAESELARLTEANRKLTSERDQAREERAAVEVRAERAELGLVNLQGYRERIREEDKQRVLLAMVERGAKVDDLWPQRHGSNIAQDGFSERFGGEPLRLKERF